MTTKKGGRPSRPPKRPTKKPTAPARQVSATPPASADAVTLGTRTVRLRPPSSPSMAFDVVTATNTNELRAICAALGMCWEAGPDLGCPAKYKDHKYNALAYGGAVLDALIARGVQLDQITHASQVAFMLLAAKLPTRKDVDDAEGFSGPGEGS